MATGKTTIGNITMATGVLASLNGVHTGATENLPSENNQLIDVNSSNTKSETTTYPPASGKPDGKKLDRIINKFDWTIAKKNAEIELATEKQNTKTPIENIVDAWKTHIPYPLILQKNLWIHYADWMVGLCTQNIYTQKCFNYASVICTSRYQFPQFFKLADNILYTIKF